MQGSPLTFLGPLKGKRILVWGVGAEVVRFALAGADVYGFDSSDIRVQAVKDLARRMGLRDQTHLQIMGIEQLAYPDRFFDLAFGKTVPKTRDWESGAKELARVMKRGARAAFILPVNNPAEELMLRKFGTAVEGKCWIGVENRCDGVRATGRIRTDDHSITNRELYP